MARVSADSTPRELSLWNAYGLGVRMLTRWPTSLPLRLRRLAGWARSPSVLVSALCPIDYVRLREFEFVFAEIMRYKPSPRVVLDLSSPKLLPLSLAAALPQATVCATDILDHEVAAVNAAARELMLDSLSADILDARHLPFADGSFDLITSVSVFEHISPEEGGDVSAARELGRVLAPGGIAMLTVPFSRTGFSEYRQGSVYERPGESEPIFFQRFYDSGSIRSNIIEPSGLDAISLRFIEERFVWRDPRRRLAQYVNSSRRQKIVYGMLYYPLSRIFLSPPKPLNACAKPYIACLVLRKPNK